ncbi:hypothetical protein BDN72DRAFT_863065 [Pluteus cervinus]|uniref:Uncharacterized protein n=1 Tax=Pluteus cervinus TaxID=181527 RepID=A0ACD3ABC4_9AGAR|nr:hypothetical protein BDN72DRAFT_863065 [Pluteus cervinus]
MAETPVEAVTYLQEISKQDNWQHQLRITYTDNPVSWRLMPINSGDSAEEIVFTIQGFIAEKTLPPVLHLPLQLENQPALLTQQVTITGLNTAPFERAVSAILDLFPVLYRQFPDGQFDPLIIKRCPITDGRMLTFSNRYFTRRKDGPALEAIDFPADIDPLGILKARISTSIIHTQENEVEYYMRLTNSEGLPTFQKTSPQTFRIGDLVQLQFSLVIYQKRTNQFICKPIFYSLASINQEFANRLVLKQVMGSMGPTSPKRAAIRPKRKVGYEVTDTASPADKRVRFDGEMDLDKNKVDNNEEDGRIHTLTGFKNMSINQ